MAFLFADANRLAVQMDRHSNFDLFSEDKPSEIRVDQAAVNRINLAFMKHDLALAKPVNVQRKDRVVSCFRAQDRCQLSQRCNDGNGIAFPAINGNRNHAISARTAGIVFAASFAYRSPNCDCFSFCHDCYSLSLKILQVPNFEIQVYIHQTWNPEFGT
jgi:hypothetical protein